VKDLYLFVRAAYLCRNHHSTYKIFLFQSMNEAALTRPTVPSPVEKSEALLAKSAAFIRDVIFKTTSAKDLRKTMSVTYRSLDVGYLTLTQSGVHLSQQSS
jgi:hypothetical protein